MIYGCPSICLCTGWASGPLAARRGRLSSATWRQGDNAAWMSPTSRRGTAGEDFTILVICAQGNILIHPSTGFGGGEGGHESMYVRGFYRLEEVLRKL